MATRQEVLAQARTLGQTLAADEAVRAYMAAQRALRDDTEAKELLQKYTAQADRIHQLEATQRPVEVADKQKLQELERGMSANPTLKQFMRAQVDYLALMNSVNNAISAALRPADQAGGSA